MSDNGNNGNNAAETGFCGVIGGCFGCMTVPLILAAIAGFVSWIEDVCLPWMRDHIWLIMLILLGIFILIGLIYIKKR